MAKEIPIMAKKTRGRFAPRVEQQPFFPGEPRTQQHFKEEVDINNIIARFKRTGHLPEGTPGGQYMDITALDFMTMQNAMVAVKTRLAALPARVRERFDNSPQAMLAFIEDPANADEARKLGLLPPLPKEPPATPSRGSTPPENTPEPPK